jgi:hypothetical protein
MGGRHFLRWTTPWCRMYRMYRMFHLFHLFRLFHLFHLFHLFRCAMIVFKVTVIYRVGLTLRTVDKTRNEDDTTRQAEL